MATFSASWSVSNSLRSSAALNDAASLEDSVNLNTLGAYECGIEDEVTIASGSPSGDVVVEYYFSSRSTSNFDTKPSATQRLTFTATGTQQCSMHGLRAPFVKRKITNSTGENGTLTSNYDYLKQVSA